MYLSLPARRRAKRMGKALQRVLNTILSLSVKVAPRGWVCWALELVSCLCHMFTVWPQQWQQVCAPWRRTGFLLLLLPKELFFFFFLLEAAGWKALLVLIFISSPCHFPIPIWFGKTQPGSGSSSWLPGHELQPWVGFLSSGAIWSRIDSFWQFFFVFPVRWGVRHSVSAGFISEAVWLRQGWALAAAASTHMRCSFYLCVF